MRPSVAALLLLSLAVTACKSESGGGPSEPSGPVTLRVFGFEGQPTSAFVIFHDFDGGAREWLLTGTNGELTFDAAPMVTVAMLNTAGDRLVAACESCHKKFKPGLTSMGIYKSPNYPPKN